MLSDRITALFEWIGENVPTAIDPPQLDEATDKEVQEAVEQVEIENGNR